MSRVISVSPKRALEEAAQTRRDQLRADVSVMRELGVAKWNEIVLGPAPGAARKTLTPEELHEKILAKAQEQHDILFGATGTRPRGPG